MIIKLIAFIWPHRSAISIVWIGLPLEDKYVGDWYGWDEGAGQAHIFSSFCCIKFLWNRNLQSTAAGKY